MNWMTALHHGTLAAGDNPLSHIMPHKLFSIGDSYTVTNHILMLIVSAVLLLILLPIAARSQSIVPKGLRNLVEAVCQFIREDMARPMLGAVTDKYIPFLWTVFFLILTSNLLGMIPIGAAAGAFDKHLAHLGGTATGNLMVTAGLAVAAFLFIHFAGVKEKGPRYFNFLFGHAPLWLAWLMIPLEIFGSFIKAFALAIRLFANMIAGHVVIAVLLGFATAGLAVLGGGLGWTITGTSILGAVFINLLELLVAFLQAYVFTYLTIIFVGMAVEPDHH